jgi:hypothetical protein
MADADLILLTRPTYPHPLPAFDPAWRAHRDGLVTRLAAEMHGLSSARRFRELASVLSDALEEAGCEDDCLLRHLREYHGGHGGPCLPVHARSPHTPECWALNLVRGVPQPVWTILAVWPSSVNPTVNPYLSVLNPGEYAGNTYCVWSPLQINDHVIVEADCLKTAEHVYARHPHGAWCQIDTSGKEAEDYGWSAEDLLAGAVYPAERQWLEVHAHAWVDLRGEAVDGPLARPSRLPNGLWYDDESILGLFLPCDYRGPGIPLSGVASVDYHRED